MPIPFKIFKVAETDFDAEILAPLMKMSQIEGFKIIQRLSENWHSGENRFNKKGEALYGAEFEGKLLGIGGRCIDPYLNDAEIARVRHLYVVPEWRHIGIGKKLLSEIVNAPAGVFKKITLRTDNPAARKFYEAHGFKYVGEGEVTHEMDL